MLIFDLKQLSEHVLREVETMKNLLWIGLVLCVLVLVPSAGQASCNSIVYCSVAAIYCSGQSTCLSGPDWVQCDGNPRIYWSVMPSRNFSGLSGASSRTSDLI